MPRVKLYADRYAQSDFQQEVRTRQGYHGLMTQNALAEAVGIPRPTLRKRLLQPSTMTFDEFCKLNAAIHPDILAVLPLLGYTEKEIARFVKRYRDPEESEGVVSA